MSIRQVVFDTETTGLLYAEGDRVIEIAGVEIVDRKITGKTISFRINNEGREIHPDSFKVHGISAQDLAGAPLFKEIAGEFLNFIRGAEIIAHNSEFDVNFINMELERCNSKESLWDVTTKVTDSLGIAKKLYPNQKNNLDALMARLDVDSSMRDKHAALLDCQLLAEVYLKMTDGIDLTGPDLETDVPREPIQRITKQRSNPIVIKADDASVAAHEAYLDGLEKENKKAPVARITPSSSSSPKP